MIYAKTQVIAAIFMLQAPPGRTRPVMARSAQA